MSALEDVHMIDIVLSAQTDSPPAAPPQPPASQPLRPVPTLSSPPKPEPAPTPSVSKSPVARSSSLLDTLRLYAAWLLAWYGLVMGLGYYVHERTLNFEIPFVEGLFLSSIVFSFLLAMFLFLFISSLVKALKGGLITGGLTGIIGIGFFFLVKNAI
jgi:hypothetical protein